MRNYIRAELYRNLKRPGYWIFNGIVLLGIIVMYGFVIYGNSMSESKMALDMMLVLFLGLMPASLYIMPVFVDMVTSEEYKNVTLRNVVCYGLSREKIFLGKLAVSVILGVISVVIMMIFYMAAGIVCVGIGPDATTSFVTNFFVTMAMFTPIWIGSMALCTLLAVVFRNGTVFSVTYILFLMISPKVVELLINYVSDKFIMLYQNLPFERMMSVMRAGIDETGFAPDFILTIIAVGAVYTLISTAVGILVMRKTDIK